MAMKRPWGKLILAIIVLIPRLMLIPVLMLSAILLERLDHFFRDR